MPHSNLIDDISADYHKLNWEFWKVKDIDEALAAKPSIDSLSNVFF